MKTFFIIPGFGQSHSDVQFVWFKKFLENKKFKVFVVSIDWNYKTMSDYVKTFKAFYKCNKSNINYVLGFSYGAMVAFITAKELSPKKVYLCSLSPEFKEDLSKMKPWLKRLIGKRRYEDDKKRSGREIAKNIKIPLTIFYGEKEASLFPQLKVRSEETQKLAKQGKLIVIKNSPHKFNFPEYKKAVEQELKNIM